MFMGQTMAANILLAAVPNMNPIVFEGDAFAMTAFKITPKKFQTLVIQKASSSVFDGSSSLSAATGDVDIPYRLLESTAPTTPIYMIEVCLFMNFPYTEDEGFLQ
jgi:hypothetical protein